jgi:putative transposase
MPRRPRIQLADLPRHVIARGNNRQATFVTDEDYAFYRECLLDASAKYGCDIHAYVLMTNHVHMLVTPRKAQALSLLMQSVGRRYVQYVNHTYKRSGTLWEGRHKTSLVATDDYLLVCQRYIELNPVRAGMVEHPADYPWSSYRHHAEGRADPLVRSHANYAALGTTPEARQAAYKELFRYQLDPGQIDEIRNAAKRELPLGESRFREEIEALVKRKLEPGKRGRPVKRGVPDERGEQLTLLEDGK